MERNFVVFPLTDIDECALGVCDHNCVNSVGSYTCSCRTGYQLNVDGHTCNGESVMSAYFISVEKFENLWLVWKIGRATVSGG